MALIHFIHIGKTGGSAIKRAVNQSGYAKKIVPHPHAIGLREIPVGEKVAFFARDPLKRFASFLFPPSAGSAKILGPVGSEGRTGIPAFRNFGPRERRQRSPSCGERCDQLAWYAGRW